MNFNQKAVIDIMNRSILEWLESEPVKKDSPNPEKSREWISCLAKSLRIHFSKKTNIKVFSIPYRDSKNNTFKSKLKEYLCDIHACETSEFSSRKYLARNIQFVSKSIIAIESEFSTDTHEAAVDLSKLLCFNSSAKIFIGPNKLKSADIEKYYLPAIEDVAKNNFIGNLYIALIPIPREVSNGFRSWRLYKLHNKKLKKIFSSDE